MEGLNATINPAMEVGLLGGDFFNNFVYRVDAAASVITLVPNDRMRGGLGPGGQWFGGRCWWIWMVVAWLMLCVGRLVDAVVATFPGECDDVLMAKEMCE